MDKKKYTNPNRLKTERNAGPNCLLTTLFIGLFIVLVLAFGVALIVWGAL